MMKYILPKGYKQTEVGVIPEDWYLAYVNELAEIKTGSRNTQDKIEEGLYPFFVRSQTIERINTYSFDGEAVLTAGDGVGTGKVFHYINGKFDAHQRVYRISKFDNRISGFFFFLYFSNNFYGRIMQMTAKSSVDSVRMEMISKMLIPLPPTKAEQERIAEALSDADSLIESLETLIAKKRLVKQGAMQELLTGKKRLPGFSGKWEKKKLGEVVDIKKGQLFISKNAVLGEIPVIAGGKKPSCYHNHSNRNGKTITISASGASAGYVAIYSFPIFASDCSTISESHDYSITYVYYQLLNNQELIYGSQTGGAQPHIHPKDLYPISIGVPTLSEQSAIAAILSDMDSEIAEIEVKLGKARQVKQGMMQELLTGKVRLV